jgi:hypothetical protein
MERFQPMPRLVLALLLALALAGFGQAVLADGDAPSLDGAAVPGIEVQPPPAQRFLAVSGRIEAVETSFFLRRPKKVAIDVPPLGALLIDDSGKGEELKQHVGDIVTLIATPRFLHDGKMVLAVRAYKVEEGHPS